MAVKQVDQLGMDERVVQASREMESALESYQNARVEASAANKIAKDTRALAMAELDKIDIPVGAVVRIGRFRVTRITQEESERNFIVSAKERLQITLAED